MINIPIQIVPISAFSPSLPKLWHSGVDIIHLLPYIQSMISDEDETENSKDEGVFSEYISILPSNTQRLPSTIDLQRSQDAKEISEIQSDNQNDGSNIYKPCSSQTLQEFPQKRKVRKQLYADKNTNTRELTISNPTYSQPTQEYIEENSNSCISLTLPGPSHSQISTAAYGRLEDLENDLTLPGTSHLKLSTTANRELEASNKNLTKPGPSHSPQSPITVYQGLKDSKRELALQETGQHYPLTTSSDESVASNITLSLPSTPQNYSKETSIERHSSSKNISNICTSPSLQLTVSPICESVVSNRELTLSTPIQSHPIPTTNKELDTTNKSFVSIVDGIDDIADVDNIVGTILLYQHLFEKRTSPWEMKDFKIEEIHSFTIELEKLDRIYYVYHFDDRVSSREYELLARMSYNGSKVFVHLSAGCDYTGLDFQGTGEIYVTRNANFFLKSIVDGSNKPKMIWQALQADGYRVSEPTEFDLLPPGLWQSVPTLAFLSHMAVYQHREKLDFYPEVLPPLLRHNLDEFIQVRSTKDHHDS